MKLNATKYLKRNQTNANPSNKARNKTMPFYRIGAIECLRLLFPLYSDRTAIYAEWDQIVDS